MPLRINVEAHIGVMRLHAKGTPRSAGDHQNVVEKHGADSQSLQEEPTLPTPWFSKLFSLWCFVTTALGTQYISRTLRFIKIGSISKYMRVILFSLYIFSYCSLKIFKNKQTTKLIEFSIIFLMELKSKIDVCIIGKMISVPNITDGIIADACWKTPTVCFLSSIKGFKYFFKR